jgi:gas vesicle protein
MEQMIGQFASYGIVGIVAYVLFKNTLDEKKQDRDLYRESVETFTETSKQYAKSIQTLSYRVENVEQGNGRIEQKLDKFIDRMEE